MDDDHWPRMVEWAYNHPDRVLSPSEVPEADRPKPCIKIAKETVERFSTMLKSRLSGIPGNTVMNLVKVFGGADLINAVVPEDIYSLHLPILSIPWQASFQFLTWHVSTQRIRLKAARAGHGDWYMEPPSALPLPSFLKGSFAHPTGNTTRIPRGLASLTSASSPWANPCQIGTPRSPHGWSLIALTGCQTRERSTTNPCWSHLSGQTCPRGIQGWRQR